jgi:hypothetical protein
VLSTATEEDLRRGVQLSYLESCAYVSLIQRQKLYFYGYTLAPPRPPNTDDAEYHLTGGGGMTVIFELTRQEFPDLFEAKDNRKKFLAELEGRR